MSSLYVVVFLSLFLATTLASDMSIISYGENHNIVENRPGLRSNHEVMSMFQAWVVKHGKHYNAPGEKKKRLEIFKHNLRYIDEKNALPDRTYKLGLNWFADMTHEEYTNIFPRLETNGQPRLSKLNNSNRRYEPNVNDSLPESIDWRELGVLAPVKSLIKDGIGCGSCWAFSAIAAVESINKMVTGELVVLSEQELVDCDTENNGGCNGGDQGNAMKFIIENGGVDTEEDYPYTARDGTCDRNKKNNAKVVSIDDYEGVHWTNEEVLKKAATHQPISVTIDINSINFRFYESGIYSGDCGEAVSHSVNIVGYGSENGEDYWMVRNSWGPDWGVLDGEELMGSRLRREWLYQNEEKRTRRIRSMSNCSETILPYQK